MDELSLIDGMIGLTLYRPQQKKFCWGFSLEREGEILLLSGQGKILWRGGVQSRNGELAGVGEGEEPRV